MLERWLRDRQRFAKAGERALFVSSRGTRISIRTVEKLFAQLRAYVGTPKRVTPHTARHSFITAAVSGNVELTAVADTAGHSSLDTTRLYVHLADDRRRDVVRRTAVLIPSNLASETPGDTDRSTERADFDDRQAMNPVTVHDHASPAAHDA